MNITFSKENFCEWICVCETVHERCLTEVTNAIIMKGARIIMLAGPSASGKTTTAMRLATKMRDNGKAPIVICLDDYYVDRDAVLPNEDGILDLEHINAIDTILFSRHLQALLSGKEIILPKFDFLDGKRKWHLQSVSMSENTVMIIEGIHALNPVLLPQTIDQSVIFRLFVCPSQKLSVPISDQMLRLIRRIIRDHRTRGASVKNTLDMWESVRKGEERWIYPFREQADYIFDSGLIYELPVLKQYIVPLLAELDDFRCTQVEKSLDSVSEFSDPKEIPPMSILREFIGTYNPKR